MKLVESQPSRSMSRHFSMRSPILHKAKLKPSKSNTRTWKTGIQSSTDIDREMADLICSSVYYLEPRIDKLEVAINANYNKLHFVRLQYDGLDLEEKMDSDSVSAD